MSEVTIRFDTPAPEDAPEVKGNRCYFRPEVLHWTVTERRIYVRATGPATRVPNRQGEMGWSVEGYGGDERPVWLSLPHDPLARARVAVEVVAQSLKEGWK